MASSFHSSSAALTVNKENFHYYSLLLIKRLTLRFVVEVNRECVEGFILNKKTAKEHTHFPIDFNGEAKKELQFFINE